MLPWKGFEQHGEQHRLRHSCRRAKNVLLTEAIEAVRKKVKKGKGVTKQLQQERQQKVRWLSHRPARARGSDFHPPFLLLWLCCV